MRILITGAAGRLGSRLTELLSQAHDVTAVTKAELDITDFDAARRCVRDAAPQIVIHTAAWTDVDGCAREPERALAINGYGTQNVALAASAVGAAMLYVSSNEVFDGVRSTPYREYDPTAPVNPYGCSKWVGEQVVMRHVQRHYIVRTAWLFAHGGRNFIQAILGAASAGKPLRVVTDEIANPTYTDAVAAAIAQLIETERFGIYHFVNEGACSRYTFARHVLDRAGWPETPIERILHFQWPRPSTPPLYSALANSAGAAIGIRLRPWQAAVDAFLERENLLRA